MKRLQGHSLDWAGDMVASPHGDWFHRSDVERLQDALEEAQALILGLRVKLDAETPSEPAGPAGRLFGWVAPDDARKFNSGDKDSCRVFKKRTELFCMPLSNHLGPNHYQKPPIGATVKVVDGRDAVVVRCVTEGLTVAVDGLEFNVNKWSWKR